MKILVTGSKGMLAKSIIKSFSNSNEIISTDIDELDITNQNAVNIKINEIKPDLIINCAAYTNVDKAEENYDLAYNINCIGPRNLAEASRKVDAILVHISTDYVFKGDLNIERTYSEEDETNPTTVYGKTKKMGEEAVIQNTDKFYIFRTAWLYGDGDNFVRTMLKLGNSKNEINVVSDQHGTPTNADDLSNIIYEAIYNKIPYGIYHATNLGFTTWNEFAKKIFELSNIKCKVNSVSTEEYIKLMNITQAKRPYNSKLSKDKILSQNIKIDNWENALKRYLENEL